MRLLVNINFELQYFEMQYFVGNILLPAVRCALFILLYILNNQAYMEPNLPRYAHWSLRSVNRVYL